MSLEADDHKYTAMVAWSPEDNVFIATSLPFGLMTHGNSEDEALEELFKVIDETVGEHGVECA